MLHLEQVQNWVLNLKALVFLKNKKANYFQTKIDFIKLTLKRNSEINKPNYPEIDSIF